MGKKFDHLSSHVAGLMPDSYGTLVTGFSRCVALSGTGTAVEFSCAANDKLHKNNVAQLMRIPIETFTQMMDAGIADYN